MKKLAKLLVLILATSLISFNVSAKPYFSAKVIAPDIIDQPLKARSAQWQDDVRAMINIQKNPSQSEIAEAKIEQDVTSEMVAFDVDPKLTRKDYPALYKLLDNSKDTAFVVCSRAKAFWKTKRPYLSDKRIKIMVDAPRNNSYPSGHTTESHVMSHVLGLLIPKERQLFYDRANEIGNHRILVGVHYPHDIKGGKQLSLLVTGALITNPDFQKDFAEAKKEIAKKY